MNWLEKYLKGGHHKTCSWFRFSDKERHCSCGWIEAVKIYKMMKFRLEMADDDLQ